ncbi:hypothetical protein HDU96_004508 [Phlyctochytrium bullatum]|nr:hypothetical protein HDU96_004508 [Phlyctochytrium bullatum]
MTTTSPSGELWVLLKSDDTAVVNHAVLVSTENCRFVTHLIDAIKKKLPNELGKVDPHRITLHLTESSVALRPGAALPAPNTEETALVVKVPQSAPALESLAYGKADMVFISETTEVQTNQEVWENMPVDESIAPCAEFVELFKKNTSVFEFETEASRRTVIDLFLREIVSKFPAFQIVCEYHMTVVNSAKKRRLNGYCDYTICHRGLRHLPHLVAIEAKSTNKETLLQCIGECASIHYKRKQAGYENRRVYGIHSTGNVWKFVFINQEGVVYVSADKGLNVTQYVEENFNLIYRLVYYSIMLLNDVFARRVADIVAERVAGYTLPRPKVDAPKSETQ